MRLDEICDLSEVMKLKECRFCKDRTKCEYAMNDYPGSDNLWKAEKYCEKIQKSNVETVSENDSKAFKEKVEKYLSQGYKISSTNCGYAGEVGGNVYDCEYWMATLIKE